MENEWKKEKNCFDFEELKFFDLRDRAVLDRENFLREILRMYVPEKYEEIERMFEQKHCVVISEVALMKVKRLLQEFPNTEWGCLLLGEKNKNGGDFYVRDIEVVEQDVGSVSVDMSRFFEGKERFKDVIGWLHSHNNMDVFFSGEDIKTAGMFDVSVVVNVKGKILACARVAFENFVLFFDCDVVYEDVKSRQLDEWVENAKSRIKVVSNDFQMNERSYEEMDYCYYCYQPVPRNSKNYEICDMCGSVVHLFCSKSFKDRVLCRVCYEEMMGYEMYGGAQYELD